MASISSLACQATSHVGAAGVGMVKSMRELQCPCPPLLLLNFSDIGRWAEPYTESCLGRIAHIVWGLWVSRS